MVHSIGAIPARTAGPAKFATAIAEIVVTMRGEGAWSALGTRSRTY